jgi:PKHD-type hydroxylase
MNKTLNNNNTSWNFELDQVNLYAYWTEAFSVEECEKIVNLSKNKKLVEGSTKGNNQNKIRNSNISWLYPNKDTDWIYRRITDICLDLNEKYFKFDLFGLNEGLQFTNYKAPSGEYDKHTDRTLGIPVRKLSISIQLTNPNNYEGGELKLFDDKAGTVVDKSQGTLIIFPSFILHQVTPVVKGERNSLVAWVTGKNFK